MIRCIYVERSIPRMLATRIGGRIRPSIAYSPLGHVRDQELDSAPLPGPRWIRVRNLHSGICATDVTLLRAAIDPGVTLAALPGRERVFLGHEVVAEVIETGEGVSKLTNGDRVVLDTRFQGPTCVSAELVPLCEACAAGNFMLCTNPLRFPSTSGVGGGWSEGMVCHESEVYKVPPTFSDDQALLIEPFSLGIRAALKRLPEGQERCLIIGGGMAGLAIAQSVRFLSPKSAISIVARHRHQAEMARRLGVDHVLMTSQVSDLAGVARAPLYRGPFDSLYVMGGFDVIYDCVGSSKTMNSSLRLAAPSGTVVLVGIKLSFQRVDLSPVWHQEVHLVGVLAHGMESWESREVSTYDLVSEGMGSGKLRIEGFITDRYPFTQWRQAVRRAQERRDGVIRVVLDMVDPQ